MQLRRRTPLPEGSNSNRATRHHVTLVLPSGMKLFSRGRWSLLPGNLVQRITTSSITAISSSSSNRSPNRQRPTPPRHQSRPRCKHPQRHRPSAPWSFPRSRRTFPLPAGRRRPVSVQTNRQLRTTSPAAAAAAMRSQARAPPPPPLLAIQWAIRRPSWALSQLCRSLPSHSTWRTSPLPSFRASTSAISSRWMRSGARNRSRACSERRGRACGCRGPMRIGGGAGRRSALCHGIES